MISKELVLFLCFIYMVGVGCCSYHLSSQKKINCFGKNKESDNNDEYTLV